MWGRCSLHFEADVARIMRQGVTCKRMTLQVLCHPSNVKQKTKMNGVLDCPKSFLLNTATPFILFSNLYICLFINLVRVPSLHPLFFFRFSVCIYFLGRYTEIMFIFITVRLLVLGFPYIYESKKYSCFVNQDRRSWVMIEVDSFAWRSMMRQKAWWTLFYCSKYAHNINFWQSQV